MKNRLIIVPVIFIAAVAAIGFFRFIAGGPEDSWQCVNGNWIRHGKPKSPMPSAGCGLQETPVPSGQDTYSQVMIFQPKQCQTLPWRDWYATGKTKFFKEPEEGELLIAYLGETYGITASKAERVDSGKMVCEACNTCPTSYYFRIIMTGGDIPKLTSHGWTVELEHPFDAYDFKTIQGVSRALADLSKKPVTDITLSVRNYTDTYATGTVRYTGETEENSWDAVRTGTDWKIAYYGKAAISCDDADKYAFPKDIVTECISKANDRTSRQ